jgi:hypothetical protein
MKMSFLDDNDDTSGDDDGDNDENDGYDDGGG